MQQLVENVNIGCGTNYMQLYGANKHQTIIEDGVFISALMLIWFSSVTIGEKATIGAGSTITRSAPSQSANGCPGKTSDVSALEKARKNKTRLAILTNKNGRYGSTPIWNNFFRIETF